MIILRDALVNIRRKDHLGRFIPFSLRFVACDTSRKLGGEFVEYRNVTLPQRERVELETMERSSSSSAKGYKPSDFSKTTLTFKTDSGEFKSCHIDLITKINDETIL